MSAVTVIFLAIGAFAIVLLGLSVFGGHLHIGDVHLGQAHTGHLGGHLGADGEGGFSFSLPVIAGFLGALGFGGAIASVPLGGHGPLTVLAATLIGLAAAVPMGWLAGRLVNAAINMPTDATPHSDDLLGVTGIVVTPVAADSFGEIRVTVAGTPMKLNARCERSIGLGTPVFVIGVTSPTSVLVEPVPGLDPHPPEPSEEGRQ